MPQGSFYLQPGEERRRTGSHYTPRKLTQPIVETTLRPVLAALGEHPTPEQILALKVCDLAMGSAAFLVEACRQLAEKLVAAWDYHGMPEDLPAAVEPLLYARRLVAQRCLYGVDKNPFAVNLAKLSLWLVTLAKDLPFTFVDHALKCGDSLVGLTRSEIGSFGKDPAEDLPLFKYLKEKVDRAKSYRSQIQALDTRTDRDAEDKLVQLRQAEQELEEAKLIGDVKISAFFEGSSKRERTDKLSEYAELVRNWRSGGNDGEESPLATVSRSLRQGEKPITPFNWDIEFPEVFDRENPGFDAIIGNPPFAGKNTLIQGHPENYIDWLKTVHPESHGNSDLVAHFFRRTFTILRKQGTFGLLSTNTVSQGDTRSSGLRFMCNNGCELYTVQKRVKWRGGAAVVASISHGYKGKYTKPKYLNGQKVDEITAFFFHSGGNDDPKPLRANADKSFQGSIVLGMGFTFDDTKEDVTPIAEMHRLIEQNPKNAEVIFPYIGGSEVNSSPTHAHHRYVINFGEMTEEEAREYPDLMAIVEEKVKPERLKQKDKGGKEFWWQFLRPRAELQKAIAGRDRVLVHAFVSKWMAFAFVSADVIVAGPHYVFSLSNYSNLCCIQSQIHEVWAYFFSASFKDDLRYTLTDCFQTFPFPENWETDPILEAVGKTYYEYRADLMIRNDQGLTDTYNRFHDPEESDPDLLKLRDLHTQMDRAVLAAYGWDDIDTTCGFALDYLDTDPDDLPPEAQDRVASGDLFFATPEEAAAFDSLVRTGKRKLPWRYRWTEATHDEVLARLLDLNQQRYEAELLTGKHSNKSSASRKKSKSKQKKKSSSNTPTIPGLMDN